MNGPASTYSSHSRNALLVLESAIDALATSTGITGKILALEPANRDRTFADADLELLVEGRPYSYIAEVRQTDRVAMRHQVKQ